MKIKDVITETGLTDRAIRLYIENGLVAPFCSESYAGRKNIDFTVEDVECLKNIATLRKAGFSIAQIKTIIDDSSTTANVVRDIISDLSEKVKSNTAVLNILKTVLENESLNVDTVCNALNNVIADKTVPAEDAKLSPAEKAEKIIFTSLGIIALVLSSIAAIYSFVSAYFNFDFLYMTLRTNIAVFIKALIFIATFILSLYIIHRYTNIKRIHCKHKRRRNSFLLCVVLALLVWICGYSALLCVFESDFCSKTTNPSDYLKLDEYIETNTYITDFMPENIPYSEINDNELSIFLDLPDTYPSTTKYYYKYYTTKFYPERFCEIIAEWKLPDDKNDKAFGSIYENEKEKYLNDMGKIIATKSKGDWQCLYYSDTAEENWRVRYNYRIFAYNDKTKTVRYIVTYHEYGFNADESMKFRPHYLDLKW